MSSKYFRNTLHEWMQKATTEEQEDLALRSSTTVGYLHKLATESRYASADIGGRIEKAAKEITRKSKGRLPVLRRGDFVPACAQCPFYKKCQ